MKLTQVRITHFKSIADSGDVPIDSSITVLVGQNEAGKTAFLQALEKGCPVRKVQFNVTEDYPRRHLNDYLRRHDAKPDQVLQLTYELSDDELKAIEQEYGPEVVKGRAFTWAHNYADRRTVSFPKLVDEKHYLTANVAAANLTQETKDKCLRATNLKNMLHVLDQADLNEEEKAWRDALITRFAKATWTDLLAEEIFNRFVAGERPKFLYFDEYQLLPGKVNLQSLAQKLTNQSALTEEDETVLRLFEMADIEIQSLMGQSGYEEAKARLEGLSNTITDQIFEYWTQNQELDVEFDIRNDPQDPDDRYKTGPNLYIRIRNRRHRATVSFSQRSKGFIWFFSFIVWFESVTRAADNHDLILLLDEPGLNLHALAQADFLRYIDKLAEDHQVIYTTHSPFMVHSDRLHQVRVVEDKKPEGTVVSSNLNGSNAKTIFPLQAALGYTIAQNLFISPRNLLVEGPADLIYLRYFSEQLESAGRCGLREDITIVPVGGLDKVATFVALLGANQLDVAIVHDWASQADRRIESLVQERIIKARQVFNYGSFRQTVAGAAPATDVEDLLTLENYLALFNETFSRELKGRPVSPSTLPPGDRVVERLNRLLKQEGVNLRASGGFNHYAVATYLASHPRKFDEETLGRFERLFASINALFDAVN
jgi:predicted ATPase